MSRDQDQPKAPSAQQAARPANATGAAPDVQPAALKELSERHGVPTVDVRDVSFPLSNLDILPLEIARRHIVIPVLVRDDAICLAMAEPGDRRVIEELEFVSGRRVFPYAVTAEQIRWLIEHAYTARDVGESAYQGARAKSGTSLRASHPPSANEDIEVTLEEDDLGDPDLRSSGPELSAIQKGPTLDSVFSPLETVQGRTVLVVDDEDDIRKLLRRVLEEKRYRVLEADRGSVALAMVKQHVPDAIVLDAMLPELHGFDICRRIKASVRYGHIPILMISAVYRGWRYAEDLKSAYGVNAYIEKPFRIADIVAAIESMLAGAPKADGSDPEALTAEAEATLAVGMDLYKRGDVDKAIAKLDYAIKLEPLSYRLHYHLALLVARKGDAFRAIQELETAIDLYPKSFSALKNLAVLYQKAGFKHKAIEMWERAISQSPDDPTRSQIKEHLMSLL